MSLDGGRITFFKPKRKVTKVFIHCSASDNLKHDNIKTIAAWHKERFAGGIGYHIFIDKLGRQFRGRDIEKTPAAQAGHNTGTIAICLSGLKDFNSLQLDSFKLFCKEIYEAYKGNITFHGHCEVSNKSCPVFDYKKILNLNEKGQMIC